MSYLTENTLVCLPNVCTMVEQDLKNYDAVSDYRKVFSNSYIAIYTFDCNGDSPWDMQPESCVTPADGIIVLETHYGWCRVYNPVKKSMNEYGRYLLYWLKRRVTSSEYNQVKSRIAYSV